MWLLLNVLASTIWFPKGGKEKNEEKGKDMSPLNSLEVIAGGAYNEGADVQ